MHFKRYNLVIISSEWIGAASYYTPLTSEITWRILTTSTAQSVLTFFSTSNSIFFFYSFFITKRTIIFIVIFLWGPDSSLAFDTYPLGLLLRTGEPLEARCRRPAGYPITIPGRITTSLFHYLSNTAFYFSLHCYFELQWFM